VKRLIATAKSFDAPTGYAGRRCVRLRQLAEIAAPFELRCRYIEQPLDLCVVAKLMSLTTLAPWICNLPRTSARTRPHGRSDSATVVWDSAAHAVIAGSRLYLERAQRYVRPDRCHLIYHGIDTKKFRLSTLQGKIRARYWAFHRCGTLGFALRFKARKGFLDLHSCSCGARPKRSVCSTDRRWQSELRHAPAYLDEMRSLVEQLDINDHLHIEDTITNDRVPWLLSGSDIVVQASLEEASGSPSWKQCLWSTGGRYTNSGHTEIISDECHGVLVEPAAPDELADTLGRCSRRRAASAARRERARAHRAKFLARRHGRSH